MLEESVVLSCVHFSLKGYYVVVTEVGAALLLCFTVHFPCFIYAASDTSLSQQQLAALPAGSLTACMSLDLQAQTPGKWLAVAYKEWF